MLEEAAWPAVAELPDWKPDYPVYEPLAPFVIVNKSHISQIGGCQQKVSWHALFMVFKRSLGKARRCLPRLGMF